MPTYAADLRGDALGADLCGRRVLILGVAYRGDVQEAAFSGAFALHRELERRGAVPTASDPLYTDEELVSLGFTPWDGVEVDAAIIQTDRPAYAALDAADVPGVRVIIDGRNILQPATWAAAGIPVRRIGRG